MKQRRLFFGGLLLFAVVATVIRSNVDTVSLPALLGDGITFTLGILYESLPFIFLGVFFSVLIQMYVSQRWLLSVLPKQPWLQRIVLSLTGSFLPVCECGNVPTARGFVMKGVAPASVLTFLFAAPIINPITLLTTSQAFNDGGQMVLLRLIGAFIIANIVGWVFSSYKKTDVLNEDFIQYCNIEKTHQHEPNAGLKKNILEFSERFSGEAQLLLPSLVGGSVLAGIIQTAVPRSVLLTLSADPIIAILVMMLLAFVVSICANVDAFFALALASVFPTSAILAFLLLGPMVDIKMLALLRTTFTNSLLLRASTLIAVLVLTISLGVHYVI